MKESAVSNSGAREAARRTSPSGYCEHASARRIRVYMPYADANTIRLRAAQAAGGQDAHVSWLYAVPGGWGWTMCPECRSVERQSA
jgi:hypothetical protein